MQYSDFSPENSQDIICTYQKDRVDATTPFHKHEYYEIFLLLNGELDFYLEQQDFHMTTGSGLFLSPGIFHFSELPMCGICDTFCIHIKKEYFRTLNSMQTNLANVLHQCQGKPFFCFQLKEIQMEYFFQKSLELDKSLKQKSFGDDIRSECLLKELLLFLNTLPKNSRRFRAAATKMPAVVTNLISYVLENLDGDLSLDALAGLLHHNSQYMSRCFKETTGIPLQQYIIQKRLELAKKYLAEGYPLTQACYASGFHDYVNFTKSFSRYVGVSPKQYQMQTMRYINE